MIDTSGWKEFRISDLFDVELSKGDIKLDDVEKGEIPLISSGETNNGVVGYISKKGDGKARIFQGNKITVDMFCNSYYQSKPFYAVSHGRVNILNPKFVLNEKIGLFISTIIQKEKFKFSYGRAVYSNVINNMIIKLPATPSGEPDWKFMEEYMGGPQSEPITTSINSSHIPLETEKWGEFRVGDIVDIINGKGITTKEIDDNPGNLEVIQSGSDNNAVIGYIDEEYCKKNNYVIYKNLCLTVARSGTSGFVTFHQDGCVVGDSAKILLIKDNIHQNKESYLFLRTILNKEVFKYNYGRKVKKILYSNTIIKLPQTPKGTPDWLWMQNYIKSLPYSDRLE